uniref:Uncharacterized protein n=1 Tax=Acrobeloides nanus TaxID=290746 RepID=A0A914DQ02_9BILA
MDSDEENSFDSSDSESEDCQNYSVNEDSSSDDDDLSVFEERQEIHVFERCLSQRYESQEGVWTSEEPRGFLNTRDFQHQILVPIPDDQRENEAFYFSLFITDSMIEKQAKFSF